MIEQPLNINTVWTNLIEDGKKPSGTELEEHITTVHNNNAGFTETVAWKSRDVNGKNSYELLADLIDENFHSKVLDLACGSGVLLDLCYQRFGKRIKFSGVDMNKAELNLARQRLVHSNIKVYRSMAQNLNFIDNSSIDVVMCHWALNLMGSLEKVFGAIRRILKKEGVFGAVIEGDMNYSPSYLEVYNIIYKYVRSEHPNYEKIELGDVRLKTIEGLTEITNKTFADSDINIKQFLLSFKANPETLAKEVAGFFYATFVLSVSGHRRMLYDLENYFSTKKNKGISKFSMPIKFIVIK